MAKTALSLRVVKMQIYFCSFKPTSLVGVLPYCKCAFKNSITKVFNETFVTPWCHSVECHSAEWYFTKSHSAEYCRASWLILLNFILLYVALLNAFLHSISAVIRVVILLNVILMNIIPLNFFPNFFQSRRKIVLIRVKMIRHFFFHETDAGLMDWKNDRERMS